jgi:hypothetical protein
MGVKNMREHGVRSVEAMCEACAHEAVVNVDALRDTVYVPDVALKLRCSSCGSKKIIVRPDWAQHEPHGKGSYASPR